MKLLHFIVLAAFLVSLPADDTNHNELLENGVETIHHIWTEWVEKPMPSYTPISEESLSDLHGIWTGSYVEGDKRSELIVLLGADGTWESEVFRPDMNDGRWYLHNGMILLFETELSRTPDLASALTLNSEKLQLLYADAEAGFIELTETEQCVGYSELNSK